MAPPAAAPDVTAQYATSVAPDSATLRADINPHFWTDAHYYLQYGAEDCSGGGCAQQPAAPGPLLTPNAFGNPVHSAPVFLSGLQPGTTYHYRFGAQSSGGGPVFGPDRTFTTPALAVGDNSCSNQGFRLAAAVLLPDCRAYEMVSPLDKEGGDILVQKNIAVESARLDQAAADGEKITYSTYRAFGDAIAGPYTSQYIAARSSSGWSSKAISPAQEGGGPDPVVVKDTQYKAFLPDLSVGWIQYASDISLQPGVAPGYINFYRRDNASAEYQALIAEEPKSHLSANEFQGFSADGRCAVFIANAPLTPEAKGDFQVYENCDGELSLVAILPNGNPSKLPSSAGTAAARTLGREAAVSHAVSADGSRVFWSTNNELYVRITGGEAQTLAISAKGRQAQYRDASLNGEKAIFLESSPSGSPSPDLYLFDVEAVLAGETASERTLIAHNVSGVLGASEDLSRVYFLSTEAIDPDAIAGKPNLYLWEEGTTHFIATLSGEDIQSELGPGAIAPVNRVAEVTPDGNQVAFMSKASLTGYENTDLHSGQADGEVFLYDADSGQLACVSCSPSGARPSGRVVKDELDLNSPYWAAAFISPGESQLYSPRVISEDGAKVFFNSLDSLLPQDTNGKQDVYEWEALGSGTCDESDWNFIQASGGCLSLISSGESASDSVFVDASADGTDVFFKTTEGLLEQDSGLIDIYDARAGGGFPPPPKRAPLCEGEACQGPLAAPDDPTPASSSFQGAGNVVAQKPRAKCKSNRAKAKKGTKAHCRKAKQKSKRTQQRRADR